MPSVVCPNCRARIDISSDASAEATMRCPKCVHTFLHGDSSSGIVAGAPITVTPVDETDDVRDRGPAPRRPAPRPTVGMISFLWIALGVLFLLLAISFGFNLWVFFFAPNRPRGFEEAMRAQREAAMARDMAEQARQNALQMEAQAKVKADEIQKKHDEALRQLKLAEEQLEDARKQLKKAPDDEACVPREPIQIARRSVMHLTLSVRGTPRER